MRLRSLCMQKPAGSKLNRLLSQRKPECAGRYQVRDTRAPWSSVMNAAVVGESAANTRLPPAIVVEVLHPSDVAHARTHTHAHTTRTHIRHTCATHTPRLRRTCPSHTPHLHHMETHTHTHIRTYMQRHTPCLCAYTYSNPHMYKRTDRHRRVCPDVHASMHHIRTSLHACIHRYIFRDFGT